MRSRAGTPETLVTRSAVGRPTGVWRRLCASWSISDPVSFDTGFGRWQEFGLVVVGVDADVPGRVVDGPVVVAAQQHEIRQVGLTIIDPMQDVVGVAHQ